MTITVTHVIFDYPGQPEQAIPLADAFAFSDASDKLWSPSRAVCVNDKGETWKCFAKGWWFHFDQRESHLMNGKLARIGAGAYGDMTVLKRELPRA